MAKNGRNINLGDTVLVKHNGINTEVQIYDYRQRADGSIEKIWAEIDGDIHIFTEYLTRAQIRKQKR